MLLKQPGININALTKHGLSPLMIAARSGNYKAVETLSKLQGIDVNLKDDKGKTALDIAK